jgi:hypothetical protein
MKDIDLRDDIFYKEIMAKSRLDPPFSDFEDNVMNQIENEILHHNIYSKEIKLSWVFFIAGSVFGIIISLILPKLQEPIMGIQPVNLAIFFQIVFTSLLFTQIDTLMKLSKSMKSN